MKIGILTQIGNNYGNRLQNYALQEYLKSLHPDIQVYTLRRNYSRNVVLAKVKHALNRILKSENPYKRELKIKFKKFNDAYISFADETVYKSRSNKEINDKYDFFIAGSDQIWNPGYTMTSKADFAVFAEKRKRLSYAASIGLSDIPRENRVQFGQWIESMYALSVREKEGAELLKRLYGKNAEVHVDPTLLLCAEQWVRIEKKPEWYDGSAFVLAYFLGDQYPEIQEKQKEAREYYNTGIVHVYNEKQDLMYIHDPSEFLWLVRHAEYVLTDSFHGTVFSILFQKAFTVFRRAGNESGTGSRIDTLLRMFGISMGTEKYLAVKRIDANLLQKTLENERKRSEQYLRGILNIER